VQIDLAQGDAKGAQRLSSELIDRLNQTAPIVKVRRRCLPRFARKLTSRVARPNSIKTTLRARVRTSWRHANRSRDTFPYISLAGVALAENKMTKRPASTRTRYRSRAQNFNALSGLILCMPARPRSRKRTPESNQVLSAYPTNASLHYLKAQAYGFERNSAQAEAELRKTLDLDPNYIAAYSALGALFINTNQQDAPLPSIKKSSNAGRTMPLPTR